MSLHLLSATSDKAKADPKNSDSRKPRELTARYQVNFQPGRDTELPGNCYWFEVDLSLVDGQYAARATLDCPAKPTMREALLKLAEWARMLAGGIEECELPEHGFPLRLDRSAKPAVDESVSEAAESDDAQ